MDIDSEDVTDGVREGFQGLVTADQIEDAIERGVSDSLMGSPDVADAVARAVKEWLTENPEVLQDAMRAAVKQ